MTTKIHYEDNVFFLTSMIKTLKAGMSLDIDPEYFMDKVIEDIFFIDSALSRSFISLKSNPYLIKRAEHLRSLLRAKKIYIDFLTDILESKISFSAHLQPFLEKFTASRSEHIRDTGEIHAMLSEPPAENEADADIISSTEYRFLLEEDTPPDET